MALKDWLDHDYVMSVATFATPATHNAKASIQSVAKVAKVATAEHPAYPKAVARLKAAAKGLPVTLEELITFYHVDLPAFEADEVPQKNINFAVKLYAKTYRGYLDQEQEQEKT